MHGHALLEVRGLGVAVAEGDDAQLVGTMESSAKTIQAWSRLLKGRSTRGLPVSRLP